MGDRRRYSAHQLVIAGALLFALVAGFWLFVIRLEPSALLMRTYYEKFSAAIAVETDHYAPTVAIRKKSGQHYGAPAADNAFDVYRPAYAKQRKLPTVVWIHGGGWMSGSKEDVGPYLRKIASAGFTVVALNYPLAPAHEFPASTRAINDALQYLADWDLVYGVDTSNIVLAGNGAGANLVSQVASLTTNPNYAAQIGIAPALAPSQLRGVVLDGGLYDAQTAASLPGLAGWRTRVELRAYTGDRYPTESPDAELISTMFAVTSKFPTTWMSAGDADPLTASQSVPFASALTAVGVPVSTSFADPGSNLPEDYQLMLALPQAKRTFASMLDFMRSVTANDTSGSNEQ